MTTVVNKLLGFLNIVVLGVGTGVIVTLIKLLYENDRNAIGAIVPVQRWVYCEAVCVVMV